MSTLDLSLHPNITAVTTPVGGGFTIYSGTTNEDYYLQRVVADTKENNCHVWYVPKFPMPNTDDDGVYREIRTRWEKQWRDDEGNIIKRVFLHDPVTKTLDLITNVEHTKGFAQTLGPIMSPSIIRSLFKIFLGYDNMEVIDNQGNAIVYTQEEIDTPPPFNYHEPVSSPE